MFYFGAHASISKGLLNAAKDIHASGGNLIQIFLTSPRNRKVSKKSEPELKEFKEYLKKHNMKVVVHSSYLVNIARNWDYHSWWLKHLELEIEYTDKIDAFGLVVHFGNQLELDKTEGYNNMFSSLLHVLNQTKKHSNVKIILETTAGQGTEMCYKLEDLSHFFKKFSKCQNNNVKDRIRLCIDTCHIFAAGYDIRNKDLVKYYLETFDELIGLRYVALLHLNDSKCDVGCKKDRHENIGKGKIGLKGLSSFFKQFRKLEIPIILETPNEGYKKEIKMLKNL